MEKKDLAEELKDILGNRRVVDFTKIADNLNVKNESKAEKSRNVIESNKREFTQTMRERGKEVAEEESTVRDRRGGMPQRKRAKVAPGSGCEIVDVLNSLLYQNPMKNEEAEDKSGTEVQYEDLVQKQRSRLLDEERAKDNMRHNKIKSRNYRRHKKNRDLGELLRKSGANSKAEMLANNPEKLENERAFERMTQRHGRESGNYGQLKRMAGRRDEKAVQILDQMHSRANQLRQRTQELDDDQDNEAESDDSDDEMDEQDEEEEEGSLAEDEEMVATNAPTFGTERSVLSILEETRRAKNTAHEGEESRQEELVPFDLNDVNEEDEESDDNVEREMDELEAKYEITQEQNDEVENEKQELAEDRELEGPQDVQTFVPGVGCWTGPGYEELERKKMEAGLVKAPKKAAKSRRRDRGRATVFISEAANDATASMQVTRVPYPYNTPAQFHTAMSQSVTTSALTETGFRRLIKQRNTNKARPGDILQPRQAPKQL